MSTPLPLPLPLHRHLNLQDRVAVVKAVGGAVAANHYKDVT